MYIAAHGLPARREPDIAPVHTAFVGAVAVPVNNVVLHWARTSLGIDLAEAAARVDLSEEEVAAWEEGAHHPPLGPLRELARLYRRPLATFLLPEVPKSPRRPADLRAAPGVSAGVLSKKVVLAMDRAFHLRAIAWELDQGEPDLGPPVDSIHMSPWDAAVRERQHLSIDVDRQFGWKTSRQAFETWRRALESRGALVFTASMSPKEVRAFSISGGDGPPAIVLGSADSDTAKCFSLFHELAHVLMGSGGICLPHEGPSRRALPTVEVWCNRFAGAVLVPSDSLRSLPAAVALSKEPAMPSDAAIEAIAARYRVSKQVLWYRLRDLEMITMTRFAAKWAAWAGWTPPKGRGRTPPVGPRTLNRRGTRFTRLVVDGLALERVTTNDVLEALSVRLGDLDAVEAELRRRTLG
jgi:Zn-dependent peptidase ImmA (M78 family)